MHAGLFEGLAHGAGRDVLTGFDATAGWPPDAAGEVRLADQRDPSTRIEDEQGHVVTAQGVVRREFVVTLAHLARPAELGRRAVLRAQRCE